MSAIDDLLKFLGIVRDDLNRRRERVPRSLLKLHVYCDIYFKKNRFEIQKFKKFFKECKDDLLKLSQGGYIFFPNEAYAQLDIVTKEDFFNKMDNLERLIEGSNGQDPFIKLIRNLEQCALMVRQLHERNSHYNGILAPAYMDLVEIGNNIPNLAQKIPERWKRRGVECLIYTDIGVVLNRLARLRGFIEDYCSRLEFETARKLYQDGGALKGSIAGLFQTLRNLGLSFDECKFLEGVPENFRHVDSPVPPLIFRSPELLIPLTRLALSSPQYFSNTVIDIDAVGYTVGDERIKTTGWISFSHKYVLGMIDSRLNRINNPSLNAEFERLTHGISYQ